MSWWEKRIQRSCGMTFISSCSIFGGATWRVSARRSASRCTWVSTTTPAAMPVGGPQDHVGGLARDPGQRQEIVDRPRDLAAEAFASRVAVPFRLLAFCR